MVITAMTGGCGTGWIVIESQYGDGSRVRIDLKSESVNIHSPHPQKELQRYAVRLVRELLIRTGDMP